MLSFSDHGGQKVLFRNLHYFQDAFVARSFGCGTNVDISALKLYGGRLDNALIESAPIYEQDFDDVASNSPHEHLRDGVSEAFRSDQTPPFGNMVAQMFSQGDAGQRTGMINHLLSALGPGAIASVLGSGAASGALSGLLNRARGQQQVQLTPEEAQQLSPDQVQALASHAEKENPGIIDHMSNFYAHNPTLMKALGGAALAIALGKMAQRK